MQKVPLTLPLADGVAVIVCMKFDHRASVKDRLSFKHAVRACPQIEVSIDTIGTFDLVVQARMNNLADYDDWLLAMSDGYSRVLERVESAIICSKVVAQRDPAYPTEFWVSCGDGQRRVDVESVTHITAERDYMRLHLDNGETCLLHTTVHKLLESLDPAVFVQIHRSTIVRRSFMERLMHQGRHWSTRLQNGEILPISKAHEGDVISH